MKASCEAEPSLGFEFHYSRPSPDALSGLYRICSHKLRFFASSISRLANKSRALACAGLPLSARCLFAFFVSRPRRLLGTILVWAAQEGQLGPRLASPAKSKVLAALEESPS